MIPHELNEGGLVHKIFQCHSCELETFVRPWITEYIKARPPQIEANLSDADYRILAYEKNKELLKRINFE